MGLLGDIFGSSEKHTDTSTKVDYPDWWLKLYKPVLQNLQSTYQQQSAQPINPLQQLGYQGMTSAAIGNVGQNQAAQGYLSQLMGQGGGAAQPSNIPSLQQIIGNFDWNKAFPPPGADTGVMRDTPPPAAGAAPVAAAPPAAQVGVPQVTAPPAVGRPAENMQQLSHDQQRLRALAAINSMGNNPLPFGAFPYLGPGGR